MSIDIVKPAVDVGVQTNDWPAHEAFWAGRLGLREDHMLKVGGGVHQHRFDLHGAVLKVNSHRHPLGAAPTGFRALTTVIGTVPESGDTDGLLAPDGIPVRRWSAPRGPIRTVVRLEVTDPEQTVEQLCSGLGAEPGQQADGPACRIGETGFDVVAVPDRAPTGARDGIGIRYLTVQVADVRAAHAHALAHGLIEGTSPIRLGDVAFISFVRLADGDWVELSQRASLTGPLPDDAPRATPEPSPLWRARPSQE